MHVRPVNGWVTSVCNTQAWLAAADQTVVVVSHDSAFLEAVATDVIVLEECRLVYYARGMKGFHEALRQVGTRPSGTRPSIRYLHGFRAGAGTCWSCGCGHLT